MKLVQANQTFRIVQSPSSDSVSVAIPSALACQITAVSAARECSFDEALIHLIEKGLVEEKEMKSNSLPADLSPRQLAVLEGLRCGLAVKEIAHNLKISEVTVRTHIVRIRERLDGADILKLRIP